MKITAAQIARWAETTEARSSLPRLVRKLIHLVATPIQINFPAGDSISLSGWDGEIECESGNSWVPKGHSYWEVSCENHPGEKATRDYTKRTNNTPDTIRSNKTLVIVTARKWPKKKEWIKEKIKLGQWAKIIVHDAVDLEHWLEQNPAVALDFADELGLSGPGVESLAKHWEDWSQQSKPLIEDKALFTDRETIRDHFIEKLRGKIAIQEPGIFSIKTDSVDEASAFVCAAILAYPDLSGYGLVVTESDGWRFVEKNPTIKIAIAARPEIAEKPTHRNGLTVIIPYAIGDMADHYRGAANHGDNADLIIGRPRIHEFKQALVSIGLDEADAERLAANTGRSWSVFRRRRAINPAIRNPAWLDLPQAQSLSTLCLLGGWSAAKEADCKIVACLSDRKYEDIEKDLSYLSQLDDAPVIKIGTIWKARSPLELLELFSHRITQYELDRFFEIAGQILFTPDPELELPDEDRFAAQIYGKARPQSSILIQSVCDTLIKLAVRGPHISRFSAANIENRISAFVRELLHDANKIRWLSLSSLLPSLAEAAPDAFLKSVELVLTKQDAPITRFFTEKSDSNMGRCWYAGLLWALEMLAWMPKRFSRVALVLARLSHIKIKGNWRNSPTESLIGIFRIWLPQTAADLSQRISVLDTLIYRDPDIAFDLLYGLICAGRNIAMQHQRSNWRDDDSGAGYGVSHDEFYQMSIAAADRLITCAANHSHRIARLIDKIGYFDQERANSIFALADYFVSVSASDEDKEVIRNALRSKIHWHRNYDNADRNVLNNKLQPFETLYEQLIPQSLVIRYRWLFNSFLPDILVSTRNNSSEHGQLIETYRLDALQEIYTEHGMVGIEEIAKSCMVQFPIGFTLAKLGLEISTLAEWIIDRGGKLIMGEPLTVTISGVLRGLETPSANQLIKTVLERAIKQSWDAEQMARFFLLAREERPTWEIMGAYGIAVENAYWAMIKLDWFDSNHADFEFVIRRLLEADRPRSALRVSRASVKKVDAKLLANMLERLLKNEESQGQLPDSYRISEAIEWLEVSGDIDRDCLIQLEFGLIPLLDYQWQYKAKLLYEAIMTDPKLFTELLCIRYKPENSDREEAFSETKQINAEIAWRIFYNCHRQPGTRPDGTIDHTVFTEFINDVRKLCSTVDRLLVCDLTLGQIFAHAPEDLDGMWPVTPVRDILDQVELETMRRGFQDGVMKKHGFTSRTPDEGGDQERVLASAYRNYASALHCSHPNLASTLDEIAHRHEDNGVREDIQAQLNRERY